VLAIGQRRIAERIKQLAYENKIPVIENRPLARALLASSRVGMMIPAALYARSRKSSPSSFASVRSSACARAGRPAPPWGPRHEHLPDPAGQSGRSRRRDRDRLHHRASRRPAPAFLLDLFISLSIGLALVVLLAALYTSDPLEFSSFPSLLLLLTLFRLALNVSSTRSSFRKATPAR